MWTDWGARQKHFQSQLILLGDLKVLYGNIINSVFSQKTFWLLQETNLWHNLKNKSFKYILLQYNNFDIFEGCISQMRVLFMPVLKSLFIMKSSNTFSDTIWAKLNYAKLWKVLRLCPKPISAQFSNFKRTKTTLF